MFTCVCGRSADRDLNAAVNLARWGQEHHNDPRTPKQQGRATNARRRDGTDQHKFTPHPRPEPMTPEKGGAEHSVQLFDML